VNEKDFVEYVSQYIPDVWCAVYTLRMNMLHWVEM